MSNVATKDFLDFVIFPSLVITYASLLAFFTRVSRRLSAHDTGLAILIQQVNPPGDKSLRSLIQEIQLEQARQSTTGNATIVPIQTTPLPPPIIDP